MLILMRHGQTTSNVEHKLDTLVPGAPLTEVGEDQARAAGEEIWSTYRVDTVISSEALRARQTAALAFGRGTAAGLADIPAVPGLQEVHAGRWEMQNSYEAHAAYLESFRGFYRRDLGALVEQGDSLELFLARYKGALMPYVASDLETGGTTVAVSHGGAIRAFAANACTVDPEFAEASYLPNCNYLVIDPAGEFGQWKVLKWGDYALEHLA